MLDLSGALNFYIVNFISTLRFHQFKEDFNFRFHVFIFISMKNFHYRSPPPLLGLDESKVIN